MMRIERVLRYHISGPFAFHPGGGKQIFLSLIIQNIYRYYLIEEESKMLCINMTQSVLNYNSA